MATEGFGDIIETIIRDMAGLLSVINLGLILSLYTRHFVLSPSSDSDHNIK